MITLAAFRKKIIDDLAQASFDLSVREQMAWWLLEKVLSAPKAILLTKKELALTNEQQALLSDYLHALIKEHKPIQYILETVPFGSLDLFVQQPILIPRPETEEWVFSLINELAAHHHQPLDILDLCTGTGCIALALAHAFPLSTVTAVDINQEALALAEKNALHNRLRNVRFIHSDLYNSIPPQQFDLIVANPPYISPADFPHLDAEVRLWEDKRALVAEHDGLAIIKEIITKAPLWLKKTIQPCLWIEIGSTQAETVKTLFNNATFCSTLVFRDSNAKDRVVTGCLRNEQG